MADHAPARYFTGPPGQQERPKVVELRQLTLVREGHTILRDVTLDIFEGESVAVLGEAGSGKSALLACMQGQVQPTEGEVRVLGASLPPLLPAIRRQMGTMPEQLDLKTPETLARSLQRFAAYYDVQLTGRQVKAYCAHYRLAPAASVATLTGLEARIFALALALVHDPRLVLLDDPLAGLSAAEQPIFWTYLQEIRREGRTLLCTCTPPLAKKYLSEYDLIMRLEQGCVLREQR
jgi:ABC-2 type transport system ATP-binding protein